MTIAITRAVSPRIGDCELTHLQRQPIDLTSAQREHQGYEAALEAAGCEVRRLPPLVEHPDGVFVEDTAVVLPEAAILTRPGAASRRAEVESVAEVLREHRELFALEAPATLDGGDVLVAGDTLYVGLSSRSNREGHQAVARIAQRLGYGCRSVRVNGCLHLKSAVTALDEHTLLLDPGCVAEEDFAGLDVVLTDSGERMAANALAVGSRILYPAHFTATLARLRQRGYDVQALELTELSRAEAGVTCCSLLV